MARVSKTNPFRTHEQRANNQGENQQDNPQPEPEPEPKAEEEEISDYEEETKTKKQKKAKGKGPDVTKIGKRGTRSVKEILSDERPKVVLGVPNNKSKVELVKPKRGRSGARGQYILKSDSHVEIHSEVEDKNADPKDKGKQVEESDVFENSETESDEACKRMKMGPNHDDDDDSDHGAGGLGEDVGGGNHVWA